MNPDSVRQAGALLQAPALENQTAAFGRHTGTKTVGALAFDTTGLICAFHCSGLRSGLRFGSRLSGRCCGIRESAVTRGIKGLRRKKEREGYVADGGLSILWCPVDNSI